MKFNKNAVGREIPEYLEGIGELVPFKGVDAIKPTKKKAGAKLRMRIQNEPKIVASIEEAIKKSGLKDAREKLDGVEGLYFHVFTSEDVVRHPLVQKIVEAYEAAEEAEDKISGRIGIKF